MPGKLHLLFDCTGTFHAKFLKGPLLHWTDWTSLLMEVLCFLPVLEVVFSAALVKRALVGEGA